MFTDTIMLVNDISIFDIRNEIMLSEKLIVIREL